MPKSDAGIRSEAKFPPDLRNLPELWARELYIHRVVGRAPASAFFREFERKRQALEKQRTGRDVAFRFADVVYFIAQAAAMGIIGNIAYDALARMTRQLINSKPQPILGRRIKFEVVVSRTTYNCLRKQKHSGRRARDASLPFTHKLKKAYSLMVTLTPGSSRSTRGSASCRRARRSR